MVDTLKSEVARGNRAFQKNHLHQAEVHYSQAIKLLETIQWPDSHSAMIATIVSFQNLIDCHFSQKDPSAAQTSCTEGSLKLVQANAPAPTRADGSQVGHQFSA